MSIKVLNHIWQTSTASGSKLLVLLALADFSDDDGGNIYPSMQTLAAKARLSVDQARRVVHQLIEDGEIELVTKGGWNGKRNLANEYRIVLDRTCNLQAPSADASTGARADASTVPAPMQDQSSYNHHNQPKEEPPPSSDREEYLPGLAMPKQRRAKQTADEYTLKAKEVGLDAKAFVVLVNALLEVTHLVGLVDAGDDHRLNDAKDGALKMAIMGIATAADMKELAAEWNEHNAWRRAPPTIRHLTEFTSQKVSGAFVNGDSNAWQQLQEQEKPDYMK